MTSSRRQFLAVFAAANATYLLNSTTAIGAEQGTNVGSFAWFDLITNEPEVARSFYEAVFGWSIAKGDPAAGLTIKSNGKEIGGLFSFEAAKPEKVSASQWVPILVVSDALENAKEARKMGAKLVNNPLQTSDGTFVTLSDPAGAYVTLYDGTKGRDYAAATGYGNWEWVDYLTHDTNRGARFYKSLVGYEVAREGNETVFTKNGTSAAGLVRVKKSQIDPNWLPYVSVADLTQSLATAGKNGAVLLAKNDDAAIIIDPTGAAIGMIQDGAQ